MSNLWKTTIFLLFIASILILAGCAKQPDAKPSAKKCVELNGFMCKANERCPGKIITTDVKPGCCDVKCITITEDDFLKDDQTLKVPQFDFGKADDNLGSLQ